MLFAAAIALVYYARHVDVLRATLTTDDPYMEYYKSRIIIALVTAVLISAAFIARPACDIKLRLALEALLTCAGIVIVYGMMFLDGKFFYDMALVDVTYLLTVFALFATMLICDIFVFARKKAQNDD